MSDLLQQAMIDAKALKEVAMKNAENALIEKYSAEFNQTVQKLLEQEDLTAQPEQQQAAPPDLNAQSDLNAPAADSTQTPDLSAGAADPLANNDLSADMTGEKNAFSKVPGSFSGDDEEMITINFDQIRATLNEMLGERYDTGLKQDTTSDSLHSDPEEGNNPVKIKVKSSKNSVTEKWEELEEEGGMAGSEEQGELEEVELMDEEPQQTPAQPTSQTPAQPAAQQQSAATSAQAGKDKEKQIIDNFLAKAKKKDPNADKQLIQDMRAAGLLKTPVEKFMNALNKLKTSAPFILAGTAGTFAYTVLLQMAINPQFADGVLGMIGLKEEELQEDEKSAANLEAQGYSQIAQASKMRAADKAAVASKEQKPSTMEEEIELTEEELQELAEELRVDLKVGNLSDGYMGSTETQKREQRTVELAAARDEKAAEERAAELEKMKDLMQENKKLQALYGNTTKTLSALKEQLEKMNLVNAKLLYTNKALGNTSLNERQKNQIVESISKADSVLAAKTIYETIAKQTGKTLDEVKRIIELKNNK